MAINNKSVPIVVKDTKTEKHVLVRVNLKSNHTLVFSGFSAWENLALLMEALGATVQQCLREGIKRKKVYRAVKDYMVKVLGSYDNLV